MGFPCSSAGKESTCNAGDPGSTPGRGRSTGEEGIGYPLQYSWASLVAQLVKNPPAMRETWVRSLGWEAMWETWVQFLSWEDPLEKTCHLHSVKLCSRHLTLIPTISLLGVGHESHLQMLKHRECPLPKFTW